MTQTRVLAEVAIETKATELPESAYAAARKMTLDTLGCAIAGYDSGGIAACLDAARERGGRAQSTVLVHGDQLPMAEAAFVNSGMVHALDYDDVFLPASLHLMSSIFPTALAVAESVRCSGREFLAALILGVEVAARLGRACRTVYSGVQAAGFLQSTIIGGFGTTAAACRLLRLTTDQTVSAMGVYYAQNSGNRQALYDKTLTKRLQPAFAARNALWAADLARRGITGPNEAIEGDAGLVRLYYNSQSDIDPDILNGFSDRWEIENVSVKQFCSCGACHPVARAALNLAVEEDIASDDIAELAIYVGEGGNRLVGMPFEVGTDPQVNAQFCSTYSAAVGVLRRRAGLAEFTSERVREDGEVANLAERTTILTHRDDVPPVDPIPPGANAWAARPHGVFVTTHDGRTLQRWCSPYRVLAPDAMNWDSVVEKFKECVVFSGICQPERTQGVIEAVLELADASDLATLVASCMFSG
jgi:2-methylcitrate dehydratase PrpD